MRMTARGRRSMLEERVGLGVTPDPPHIRRLIRPTTKARGAYSKPRAEPVGGQLRKLTWLAPEPATEIVPEGVS